MLWRVFELKKLLFQLDTDPVPNTFDTVVGYDGGADHKIERKRAVILAGTGPFGQRAALMLAKEGAEVAITSRKLQRAQSVCNAIEGSFGVKLSAAESDNTLIHKNFGRD